MTEILPFLKDLISVPGLSGYEDPAAKIITDKWQPLVHEIQRGKLGSLHGLRRGTGKEPRPSVMVSTHMDAIGLMVTGITDGFLRVTRVGGVDPRVLPGTAVTVFASGKNATGTSASGKGTTSAGASDKNVSRVPVSGVPGVVVMPSPRLLPAEMQDGPVPLENLFIDTGLPPVKVAELVRVGDVVAFAQPPVELSGETLSGHTLDNRASVAALTVCLEELQSRPHVWDVWAVASSQEEVGALGAAASTFELHPTLALVVDVTFAKGPGATDWGTFPLGKGPTLAMGANMHPALHKAMKELADRLEIPYALEYTPSHSGTDGWATQVAAEGIPTMVVGIPLRYMHTPVEVVALKDIQRAGRLLAEFIAGLGADFMEGITWE
jgi:putative aminopeptidase FrvX